MEHTKTYRKYKENSKDKFVRYSEGAEMYHISVSKFMQMAKDAIANRKIVLLNGANYYRVLSEKKLQSSRRRHFNNFQRMLTKRNPSFIIVM